MRNAAARGILSKTYRLSPCTVMKAAWSSLRTPGDESPHRCRSMKPSSAPCCVRRELCPSKPLATRQGS